MGIVNALDVAEDGSLISVLITPHGDRKLQQQAAKVRANGGSLPLMGIVNPYFPTRAHGGRVLITPHGDRKPGAWPADPGWTRPHYPSWGS